MGSECNRFYGAQIPFRTNRHWRIGVSPALDVKTTRFGGTGRDSHSLTHTQTYPHRLEAGTINIAGVFGLSAGLHYISRHGVEKIYSRELDLGKRLHYGLISIKKVQVYASNRYDQYIPIILCNVDGMDPEDLSNILDGDFGIAARAGLHSVLPWSIRIWGPVQRGESASVWAHSTPMKK